MIRSFPLLIAAWWAVCGPAFAKPNVLVVITDDQGYGDLGFHGNPVLKTPNLDAFAKRSVRFNRFYVSPVCSPTRSSLLTGRYTYRTGIVDTFLGRSMMHGDETTLAEVLKDGGYRTGLFGKWHLGDNYPMRPQDQGFQTVLMHRGGGIAQPSDPPGGSNYQDPVLFENGVEKKFTGYVTDIFTDAAIKFVNTKANEPFFAYVAYNCPHSPFQVQDADWEPYKNINDGMFPKIGQPWLTGKFDATEAGKAYGMIANIDRNFQKLINAVPEDTLVIFLTDNGVGGNRWNAGLRNRKGTVYEGGTRAQCFMSWKAKWKESKEITTPAAHIDLFPTILEACGVKIPKALKIDGRSLLALIENGKPLEDRTLFLQWHRGDVPELYRAFTAIGGKYKLVQASGAIPPAKGKNDPKWKFELFDIPNDPFEEHDLAAKLPDEVAKLKTKYEAWFADVKSTRQFAPPRIAVGAKQQPVTVLTRQDWRGDRAGWQPGDLGEWMIDVTQSGTYRLTLNVNPVDRKRTVSIGIGDGATMIAFEPKETKHVVEKMKLEKGEATVRPSSDDRAIQIQSVTLERIGN
ncbi:arylsulfatase [Zavarzinella formosa]|uniref:arylsulfatase n=1 Tax=Zavarzinella formosa TaxID=360055 RepID=UPI0002D25A39|nr:arylsulfatase [Zavarzinella formosa]